MGWVVLAVWILGAVVFFALIQREAKRNSVSFNVLQLVVAIGWPIWLLWYGWILLTEK